MRFRHFIILGIGEILDKYLIQGGKPLYGTVEISGAKNAAVAIIPAALMVNGIVTLENLPRISDVDKLLTILECLGAQIKRIDHNTVEIDCREVHFQDSPFDLMRRIRASYYLIGAMLGRFGTAKTTMPGGCNFGSRPIDQHIKGLEALGASVVVENGFIYANAPQGGLIGGKVCLDMVSVGATMNIMLAAVFAKGKTVIENAAREPHIVDLANFLNSMGADVRGAGTDTIKIYGVEELHGGTYAIIPDQIEAGTFMCAVAAAGGDITITNVIPRHLECISSKLRETGTVVEELENAVRVYRNRPLKPTQIKTMPYPGFPTDMQPQMGVLLSIAAGEGSISEGIYDNRFKYCDELRRMGADVTVTGAKAVFKGVEKLHGERVRACDLRAGAAVVIAGLCAEGVTSVEDIHYIERGYEDFVGKLTKLGAKIRRESDECLSSKVW